MTMRVVETELRVLEMTARLPFRYGSAELRRLPHILLSLELEMAGVRVRGLACEGLPPKWFTKEPGESFADEIRRMLEVIEAGCRHVLEAGAAGTVFDLWWELYARQKNWAKNLYPPLLWGLGVSLVERALIDAFCKGTGQTFSGSLRNGSLGFTPDRIHAELKGMGSADGLPLQPSRSLHVRQTVGLSDVLFDRDLAPDHCVEDGLPHALEDCIRTYGLDHLKIKWSGNIERDVARMKEIMRLSRVCDRAFRFTIDGNEQYPDIASFRDAWEAMACEPEIRTLMQGLLFVEQPLARNQALGADTRQALLNWKDRPPVIVDESDGELHTVVEALDCGYAGTSHKNCKGVFKGLANARLIARRRKGNPQRFYVLSGEDLANVGPVALLQDLAVMANLGLEHVERNGHHYFRGLSMYGLAQQRKVTAAHPDLYAWNTAGFASLQIRGGAIQLGSVNTAPFGCAAEIDPAAFQPLQSWKWCN